MFKVTARTILELGAELISSDAIAFYELIKNGIDAGSKSGVTIHFNVVLSQLDYQEAKTDILGLIEHSDSEIIDFDEYKDWLLSKFNKESKGLWDDAVDLVGKANTYEELLSALNDIQDMNSIIISDAGSGMSLDELDSVFLVIGTSSRKSEVDAAIEQGLSTSPFLGEKGIGRLSAMRLGDRLSVITTRLEDKFYNHIDIDWTEFDDASKMVEDIDVRPRRGGGKNGENFSGTEIKISKLNSDWSEKRVERLAIDDFSLLVNPLGKVAKQRIAVFWNEKRIDIKRLEKSFLSHANALVKGSYRVKKSGPELELRIELDNIGFEHPREVSIEVVSSDILRGAIVGLKGRRKRMNRRDVDYSALNSIGPFEFELHWFNRAILRKGNSRGDYQALHNLIEQWMGVRLYRDGFRVYPYGSEGDDWLDLDKTALGSKGYALNRLQLIGQVEISRLKNPQLIDQTNREGLRHTREEVILKETVQFAVERLRDEMNRITKEQREIKKPFINDGVKTLDLESRMKAAIKSIRKVVPAENKEIIQDLEMMREEFSRYLSQARERIADMEKDADQMLSMAGVGLMVEVVAHELTRSAEDALDVLNALKGKSVPDEIRRRLESLRASMTSITKRLRILDPLSVTGRQRKERFDLAELLSDILDAHETQFKRHGVSLRTFYPERPVKVFAVKGMVVQVLENLISNSIYWLDIERQQRKMSFKPEIVVSLEDSPPRVRFSDNGPGISDQYKDRVFDLFFSLKQKSQRRGLGLYIAREAAEHNGGSLVLDPNSYNDEGRFSTFDYCVMNEGA